MIFFFPFFLQALQCPQFFGGENMQLVQPDLLFSFAVDFLSSSFEIWCLDLVLHYKYRELEVKILKVTLLSTF